MIPHGTLCLLVAPHDMAGRTCTVLRLRPPGVRVAENDRTVTVMTRDREVYDITIPSLPPKPEFIGWCADRRELVPLAPPPDEMLTLEEDINRFADHVNCGVRP
jgi:hypothetical protein